jgi:hypothetical protein
MLNFKYGIHDNLKNQGIVNGTIYVTTDEKAMYVDLDNTRIRLSQIITLTTYDWQTLTPPYSTEAFYYLSDSNALLKYTGNAWVQINSTKDLRDALTGLGFLGVLTAVPTSGSKGQICTVNGVNYIYSDTEKTFVTFGKVGAEILDLKATVASHTTTLTTYGTDITNLKTADTEIRTALASLGQAVGYVGSGATLPQNPAVGDVFIHNGTIKVYCKESPLSEAAPAWQSLGNESYRIDVLRARIEAVAEAAGDKEAVAKLRTDLTALQGTVTDSATGLAATKAIADAAKATAEAALPKSEFNTFKTSNTQAIADAKKAGTDAQASANTANSDIAAMKKDASITTFKGLEDKIDNLTATDISGLDDIYATDKQLSDAKTAILGEANYGGTVKGAYTAANDAQTSANTANSDIATMLQGASTLKTFKSVEDKFTSITSELNNLDSTYATDDELADAKEAILGEAGYTGTVKGAYTAANNAQTAANTANSDIANIVANTSLKTFKAVEDKIAGLKTTDIAGMSDYATDTELSNAVAAARGQTAETVASVDAKARTNADNITKNAQDIADLRGDLEDGFKAADAMIYKGTISTANGLPTSVEIGWTYKVTEDIKKADFSANINWATTSGNPNDDVYVRAGDLFIATGDEGTDGKITAATLEWDHIPAGYNADYVPVMTTTITNNIVNVELTSAHAADNETGDLGEFQVSAAEGSAVSVSLGAGSNIVIGMTWGTF